MYSVITQLLVLGAIASRLVAGGPVIRLCTEGKCGDCPAKLEIEESDGYPFCGHWNTTALAEHYGTIPASKDGGHAPFLKIPQPDPTCKIIIRKPTRTDAPGCGIPIAAFHHATCFPLPLPDMFMVQYCCGEDECLQSGLSSRRKRKEPAAKKPGGKTPQDPSSNACKKSGKHTRVRPSIDKGFDVDFGKAVPGRVTAGWLWRQRNFTQWPRQTWVHDDCHDCGSWRSLVVYTKPSLVSTPVSEQLDGGYQGGQLSISVTRGETWSSSVGVTVNTKGKRDVAPAAAPAAALAAPLAAPPPAALSRIQPRNFVAKLFGKFFGLSVNVGHSHSCSISDSRGISLSVGAHKSGLVVYTAFYRCEIGMYTCKGRWIGPHEICHPLGRKGELVGMYSLVTGN